MKVFSSRIVLYESVTHCLSSLYLNSSKDPFNDLDDPFVRGHKNFSTKLLDEHQSISGLPHDFVFHGKLTDARKLSHLASFVTVSVYLSFLMFSSDIRKECFVTNSLLILTDKMYR